MAKQLCETTGWHEFGQVVFGTLVVCLAALVLYLLFGLPYERHKEVMSELNRVNNSIQQVQVYQYRKE